MLALPNTSPLALTSSTSSSFLLCGLDDTLLGMEALAVSEVVPLPAIAPIAEKAPGVQGVLNLRGRIVPVLDLRAVLGFEPRAPRPEDRLVVLEQDGQLVALPVDEVHDVQSIAAESIETGRVGGIITGLGRVGDAIVQLLRLETIHRLARISAPLAESASGQQDEVSAALAVTLPTAWKVAPEVATLFRERAATLAKPLEAEGTMGDAQSFRHLAAVRLGGEYFGLDLRFVREFSPLQGVTPVPCSPGFVQGLVNLRGEILTLVDARPSLGLSASERASASALATTTQGAPAVQTASGAQIVVVEDEGVRLGLAVDEVIDVFTIKDALFAPAPSAAREEGELTGSTVYYGNMRLSVLDLPKLIALLMSQSDALASEV